jgi:hypothetical protein
MSLENAQERKRLANHPRFDWLESLIKPSVRALRRHAEDEAEAASLARTMREARLQ